MRCEDCGTTISRGVCPNCEEELYIYDNQICEMDEPIVIGKEFAKKVSEQRIKAEERRENGDLSLQRDILQEGRE